MSLYQVQPLNTEWNRKTNILPGKGIASLLGIKHGIAYFTWTDLNNGVTYLQCDENILKKHFKVPGGLPSNEVLDGLLAKKARFLRYPLELSGK